MVKNNTLLGYDLFNEELSETLIFHIPHSKYKIPDKYINDFISKEAIENENLKLVDHATDRIFDVDKGNSLIFEYSRIFCDVERLPDEQEVMFKYGRGFYYTKTDDGDMLRDLQNKDEVYKNFYLKHHNKLDVMVDRSLERHGFSIIIDCHSFNDKPFNTDLIKEKNRPDFCLGVDDYHTPKWLVDIVFSNLTNLGYNVKINNPYKGTIVPIKYYKKNKEVISIMIEINRKLYIENDLVVDEKVNNLNKIINNIF